MYLNVLIYVDEWIVVEAEIANLLVYITHLSLGLLVLSCLPLRRRLLLNLAGKLVHEKALLKFRQILCHCRRRQEVLLSEVLLVHRIAYDNDVDPKRVFHLAGPREYHIESVIELTKDVHLWETHHLMTEATANSGAFPHVQFQIQPYVEVDAQLLVYQLLKQAFADLEDSF